MAMLKSTEQAQGQAQEGQMTPEGLKAKMHLTPEQSQQLDRIVLAGKKVMFSERTHKMMLEQLDGPAPVSQKIGQGVAGLLALLRQESRGSIPPNLLIPAGMILCAVAAQFLRQAGQDVTDQDIGAAIEAMTSAVLYATGVNPEKLAQASERGGKQPPGRGGPPQAMKATAKAAQEGMQ